MTAYETIKMI